MAFDLLTHGHKSNGADGADPVRARHDEQRRSHISDGHRLIRLARQRRLGLYTEDELATKALYVSPTYWMESVFQALRLSMSEAVALRTSATIARARKHAAAYGVKRIGVAEQVAEAFYDSAWYRLREDHIPRPVLRDRIADVLRRDEPLELVFPIFSRKPLSPLKNGGPWPDLAEIVSLARCAAATRALDALCSTGCRLTLLCDGLKYSRACRTPAELVRSYQDGLRFWARTLAVDELIRLVDYEEWLAEHLPADVLAERALLYCQSCEFLGARYRPAFDATDPGRSLAELGVRDDVGSQLAFTYWSIVTSVHYRTLFSLAPVRTGSGRWYSDDLQRLYLEFVVSLPVPLAELDGGRRWLPTVGCLGPSDFTELFYTLRSEAFDATVRYIAISRTDRQLNVLRRVAPRAIKLTIHGKAGEVHFVSAPPRDAAMTAQHGTGGVAGGPGETKVTFRYRGEREADGERPVLLEAVPDTPLDRARFGPLASLRAARQPIAYVTDASIVSDLALHRALQQG